MYRDKKGNIWETQSEFVDLETGEMLTKYQVERYYRKIRYIIIYNEKYTKNGEYRKIKKFQWECRKLGKQTTLF